MVRSAARREWAPLARASVLLLSALLALPVLAGPGPELPPVTAEGRATAFPDLDGDMSAHMDDDPLQWMLLAEQLEWQDRDGDSALRWDVNAWAGYDMNRLLLQAEGDRTAGTTEENRLELFWAHALAARWDLLVGGREEFAPGPSRTLAGIGIRGLAPYWIRVEATAFAGERGQTAAALQLEYELLLTNRLILAPRLEVDAYGKNDEANHIGHGLSDLTAGLRLRYEIRREFAPYIGVEWAGKFGETADFAREADEHVRDTALVAGVRVWF